MNTKSVNNISHDICTGCMMCGDLCPKDAIQFQVIDGFWYPIVNERLCTNCGLCSKKCPAINIQKEAPLHSLYCVGARTKEESVRMSSTSGGFFSEVATEWMKGGGVVVGAEYSAKQEIIHAVEKEVSGIEKLRQSKYAQSKTEGIYRKTKELLKQDVQVLFCGTPCQVEALKAYLRKPFDNLVTLDFICLGICSPLVYQKYLDMLEKKYSSKTKRIWFKNKRQGWRSVGTLVQFENGKEYFRTAPWDLFMRAFIIDSLAMRPNCETCKFRKIPHNSDFTLGDFWGIENINPQMDDNLGLSAVFINTKTGLDLFDRIKNKLLYFETKEEDIISGNFSAVKPKSPHPNSRKFMQYIMTHTLEDSMNKYSSYNGIYKLKMEISLWKQKIKKVIKSYGKSKS